MRTKRNSYWISENRYYELKHFCMQYPEWQKELLILSGSDTPSGIVKKERSDISDPSGDRAVRAADLSRRIEMVDRNCKDADAKLYDYIFKAAVYSVPYDKMKDISCSKPVFYDRYKKFFFLLDKER